MAENLRTTRYRDGTSIPNISNDAQWSKLSTGAWCWYGNDVNNKAAYGALYNWFTVVDSRHLCPAGWHVPGDAEWTTLITLYGESIAGGKMKETGTTHWNSPNTGADNFSGFKGLPGGGRQMGGTFAFAGSQSFWWSNAAKDDNYAWSRYLAYNYTKAYRYSDIKLSGFSVRCIQD
ncbi:MAG: fibrobacter succinogenes major paralogous domain-containing protein [Bacteroidia bacterium]|nr:fibrobacter succinogenes major paralogous domain-containing protein [Bacteroidia bacterium]